MIIVGIFSKNIFNLYQKLKILTFSVDVYDRSELDELTDVQLYEYANIREFTDDINSDLIDSENNWVYFVKVD